MKSGSKQAAGKAKVRTPKRTLTRVEEASVNKSSRVYDSRTVKLLWGRSAGRCAMPDCRIELFVTGDYDPICIIGEMGHVIGSSDSGPRPDSILHTGSRDAYENLILLCRNCHKKVDGLTSSFPVHRLHEIKNSHEAWVRTALPERGFTANRWKTIRLQGSFPFDASTIGEALLPDQEEGEMRISVSLTGSSWSEVQDELRTKVESSLHGEDSLSSRIAVFPLAPVSACLYLGFLLTNRLHVRAFQYHRDAATWAWPNVEYRLTEPTYIETVPAPEASADVFFVFQLTAPVDPSAMRAVVGGQQAVYECSVANPSSAWLQSKTQLDELARKSREMFEEASIKYRQSGRWHVLYAGPAPGAVVVGQQLNPTMVPPTQFYEFQRPNHLPSILTSADDSAFTRWTSHFEDHRRQ
jgi:hypothetical protein